MHGQQNIKKKNSLVPAKNEEFLSFPARNPTTIPSELSWLFD